MPNINLSPIKTRAAQNGEGLLTDEQWKQGFQNATAGFKGIDEGRALGEHLQDRQVAQEDRTNKARIDGYKAILSDPNNAQMIAQMHGIEYTPTLQKMIQQPQMLQNVIAATEFASKAGIKNPEATQKLMIEAAKQAQNGKQFNPVEVFGAIEGMDTQEPMNEYQRGMIGIYNQRLDRSGRGGGAMPAGKKAIAPWEDSRVPAMIRLEGQQIAAEMKRLGDMAYEDQGLVQRLRDYVAKTEPYTGGNQQYGTPPFNPDPSQAPNRGVGYGGQINNGVNQVTTRSSNVPVGTFWGD